MKSEKTAKIWFSQGEAKINEQVRMNLGRNFPDFASFFTAAYSI